MPEDFGSLEEQLRYSTAKIFADSKTGTGFFVAPRKLLTCAHVVESALKQNSGVTVAWSGAPAASCPATLIKLLPSPFPDLALLHVDDLRGDHPCVLLHDAVNEGDTVYSYGYTDEYPGGDSALLVYEGPSDSERFFRFKGSQIRPGSSGSPLLNRRTGAVCGILRMTRDRKSDLGGRGVSAGHALDAFEGLLDLQKDFHSTNPSWSGMLAPEQLRIIGMRVAAKHFYLAVLDGKSPEQWAPFNGHALGEINDRLRESPRLSDPPYPTMKTYLSLRLDEREKLLSENLTRVFGVIVDGIALIEGRSKPVNQAKAYLEFLVANVVEHNDLLRKFGFSACAIFPQKDKAEFDYLHKEIRAILESKIGNKCERRVSVLTHEIALEVQLENELSRFANSDTYPGPLV